MLSIKELNVITHAVIGCAIEVHKRLGPGLLESIYDEAMCLELGHRKIDFCRQLAVPIRYRDTELSSPLRLDLLVHDSVILELKAIDALAPVHDAQLLSYLKLTGRPVGLLINFNVAALKQGIRRKLATRAEAN